MMCKLFGIARRLLSTSRDIVWDVIFFDVQTKSGEPK